MKENRKKKESTRPQYPCFGGRHRCVGDEAEVIFWSGKNHAWLFRGRWERGIKVVLFPELLKVVPQHLTAASIYYL